MFYKYTGVRISGEDPKYRSTELNVHGPTVKGWQSEKKCEYPQEIILKLEKRYILTKIQLLAHQYLIRKFWLFVYLFLFFLDNVYINI